MNSYYSSMLIIIGNKKKLNKRKSLYKRSKYLTIWKTLKKGDKMRLFNKNDSLNSKLISNQGEHVVVFPKWKKGTKTPTRKLSTSIRIQGLSTPKRRTKTPIRKISTSIRIQGLSTPRRIQGLSTPKRKTKTPIRKISKSNRIQGYLSPKNKIS